MTGYFLYLRLHGAIHLLGGGGLTATLDEEYEIGQPLRTKIFLRNEASAIYCYSQVIDKQDSLYTLAFTAIRASDQELLVRASLHAQTRQLKLKQKKSGFVSTIAANDGEFLTKYTDTPMVNDKL